MITRWILAAGTLVNLVFGVLGLIVLRGARHSGLPLYPNLRKPRSLGAPLRLFLWTLTAFNLLLATGYFLFSGVAGIGDWAEWMKGLTPVWAWRLGFTLLGIVTYGVSAWLLARELVAILGSTEESRLRRMTWVMYFAGGLAACLAA